MGLETRIIELNQEGLGRARIVKELAKDGIDITEWKVRMVLLSANDVEVETNLDGSVTVKDSRLNEVPEPEELLARANLDPEEWEVDEIRNWDAIVDGRVRVFTSARFRPTVPVSHIEQFKEQILSEIREYSPAVTRLHREKKPHMMEISLYDMHAGKIARAAETGDEYNLERSLLAFDIGLDGLLDRTDGFPIDKIVLPVGNDLLHHEISGTTARGTWVGDRDQWLYVFQATRRTLELAVLKLLMIAPVHIIIVAGNHDPQSTLSMGEVLDARFWNNDNVTVDNGPRPRKYFEYGKNLIGFTHGHLEKSTADLPLLMASEEPEKWARTAYREFHIGHGHKKQTRERLTVDEYRGVRVRQIPSIDGTDAWHNSRGWTSLACAEAYLWHREEGNTGQFSVNIPRSVYE